MRRTLASLAALASLISLANSGAVLAQAEPVAAETPAQHYTAAATAIGDLLDDPAAKAILEKHVPGFSGHPQIDMARGMTLKQVQGFAADVLTDEVLAKVDADFAALPAKK